MNRSMRVLVAIAVALFVAAPFAGQTTAQDTADAHVAAAKAAAGNDQPALLTLCNPPAPPAAAPARGAAARGAAPQGPPPRSQWAAEPVKVFDNLYYVGEKDYSSWAVTTSAGIIIVDAIFDYSVAD